MKNKMKNRMKGMKNTRFLWLFLTLFCGIPAEAGTISGNEDAGTVGELVAFPGAEGFGRNTTGGRGGRVYHVTTLEDGLQEGTLRHALSRKGARTVVFDVAGTIFLNKPLRITDGDLTIAGQTAPGQGICIARCPVTINANNVIVRYLRFRVGNEGSGEPDGLGSTDCKNVIIDHCSISWSVDECCSVYGGENLTVQWCLVSESLRTAGHAKGRHGYGAIWGGAKASFHHNLLAHHESRVPRLGPRPFTQEREHVDMRNNVFYNWAGNGCYGGEAMHVNIVNNYYKPGPATPKNSPVRYRIAAIGVRTTKYCTRADGTPNVWKPMEHVWGTFYVDGNVIEGSLEVTKDNWTKGIYEQINTASCDNTFTEEVRKEMRLSEPLDAGVVTTHTAKQAYKLVLDHAGCSKQRDIIDERIIKETRKGTATYIGSVTKGAENVPGLIDLPADVKPAGAASPWPELSDGGVTTAELRDTDGDGMPDVWETAHGLNPADASDGISTTLSKEGYTNLEVYLNGLVK
ncbi:pectate lyase [Bacteroides stercorirosoris]|uniref:pectate lyase n=1 Tax=Bacteroides stercorirosoris TaxID=871324 RepID=UPI0023F8ACD1|nr:pectate lyase [Bacteroides stercorirosoris]